MKITIGRPRWKEAVRDRGGAMAVEFALVAVPFLALLFAILETGVSYIAGGMLQTAVAEAGRGIMTGEFRQPDQSKFRQAVCDRLVVMLRCGEKLSIDVRSLKSLQGAARSSVFVNGVYDTSGWTYAPGGAGGIVVVTAAYPWPSYTSLLAARLSAPHVLIAASAFKNEQF